MKRIILSILLLLTSDLSAQTWPPTGGGGDGSGDVTGPGASTDNAVTRFDGTGGKTLQNSSVIIDDSGNMSGVGTLDVDGVADFSTATSHMLLPSGTTAQRSGTTAGQFRFNSTSGYIEYYSGGWVALDGTGEANTGSNVGGGTGEVFKQKSALDLQFKTINGGNEITITNNASTIDIASDITLPGSSTDNTLPRFDSTTGKVLQTSGVTVDDSNNVSAINNLDVDGVADFSTQTSHLVMPSGTTAQRPGSPAEGQCRYNSTETAVECYQNSAWVELGSGAGGSSQIDFQTKENRGRHSTDGETLISFTSVPTDKVVWVTCRARIFMDTANYHAYARIEAPYAAETFATTDVNTTSDEITITGHGFETGDAVELSSTTTLPAGISASTTYAIEVVDANTILLHEDTSALIDAFQNAYASTAGGEVDITDQGTGTHSVFRISRGTLGIHDDDPNHSSGDYESEVSYTTAPFTPTTSTIKLTGSYATATQSINYIENPSCTLYVDSDSMMNEVSAY